MFEAERMGLGLLLGKWLYNKSVKRERLFMERDCTSRAFKGDKTKMKTLTRKELNEILEEHKHWINEDCSNWEEMRADLGDANLHNADLRNADLRGAYLLNADLSGADLRGANLHNADLGDANLRNADLRSADLSDSDLRNANLRGAYLLNADLSGADLRGAYLLNANLGGAENVPYIPMVCPEEGGFIAWKKAEKAEGNKDKVIVKLHIPFDAKRSSATTRMCRCSKAEVIAIYNLDGTEAGETICHSHYDHSFVYEVGKTVEVTDFSEDRWRECAKGIHFFISRQEAIDY